MLAQLLTALVGALIRSQPKKKPVYRKPTKEELQPYLDAAEEYGRQYEKEYGHWFKNSYRSGGYEVPDSPGRRAGAISEDERLEHPAAVAEDEKDVPDSKNIS